MFEVFLFIFTILKYISYEKQIRIIGVFIVFIIQL